MPDRPYSDNAPMPCRAGCGACCIAISISSPIPGMPDGKEAGEPCVQLDDDGLCCLFGDPSRPAVCGNLQARPDLCGEDHREAFELIAQWERATAPAVGGDSPASG